MRSEFHPSPRSATTVCVLAMMALAVAMGVGRFAFTPLLPLMARDGLLEPITGSWLAGSNYLGYLLGALTASRRRQICTTDDWPVEKRGKAD